jgi:putative membrane protein
MMMGGNGGWGWLWFGNSLMVIFWVVVIALIVWLVYRLTRTNTTPNNHTNTTEQRRGPSQNLLEILQARYARGEINREQYETMRRNLQLS